MLSFLRPKPKPRIAREVAPLREAAWDGSALTLAVEPGLDGESLAIDIDGAFFDAANVTDNAARFAFPFAPTTRRIAHIEPRRGRDGASLVNAALAVAFGEPGFRDDALVRAPLDDDGPQRESLVPFGVDAMARDVAIVVPVYNAAELVERCLESLIAHTTGRTRLIVIDDASTDAAIAPLLERYGADPAIRVLRNARNLGFTATANCGIAEAGRADVVLLNADTEVGPNWLTGLRRAAASASDVATVTAVSDNAGAFSVPELERENTRPASWSFDDAARALWQRAGTAYPALPTGNGFCLYIRRDAIDRAGMLDEIAFPQGYGEENDFCQRASAQGLRHLVAGNVYVHHARSASFGHERRAALGVAGMAVLRERWPNYEADVGASLFSYERRVLDWRVRRIFVRADVKPAPRILIAGASDVRDGVWHLAADGTRASLHRDGALVAESSRADEAMWRWLQIHAFDAVVATAAFPTALPRFCAALGIPFAAGGDVAVALDAARAASRSFGGRAS